MFIRDIVLSNISSVYGLEIYDKKIFGCTVKNVLASTYFLLKNESNEDVVTRTSLDFLIFKTAIY